MALISNLRRAGWCCRLLSHPRTLSTALLLHRSPTNGSIYLMAHMLPGGEAIIHAESWRGPYTVVAASTDRSWGNSTTTKATEE